MLKKCKVVMLPTNEKAQLVLGQQLANVGETDIPNDKDITKQHLYITSDDEIKSGDNFLNIVSKTIHLTKGYNNAQLEAINKNIECKKIIATTDSSLKVTKSATGYTETRSRTFYSNESLPQPSQSFIEKYVEEYNKGNIITDVLVEYEEPYNKLVGSKVGSNIGHFTLTENNKYRLKINPDNTINIVDRFNVCN